MSGHLFEREIDRIERAMFRDDPDFARRIRALDGSHSRHEWIVVTLLAASAVLFAVGLVTLSPAAWIAGAFAFVTSSVVDAGHERQLEVLYARESRESVDPHRLNRLIHT